MLHLESQSLRHSVFTTTLATALLLIPATFVTAFAGSKTPIKNSASQITITLTNANGGSCVLNHNKAKAGPITFTIKNETATSISEVELLNHHRILGEKENLAPGLPARSFTVTLGGGNYKIYCPGAHQPTQSFIVTGKTIKATGNVVDLLNKGVEGYSHYVDNMVDNMVTAITQLKADIDANNLKKAKAQYPKSRVFYERIESDVEGFILPGYNVTDTAGSLDYLIDMRRSSLDPKVGWHGFHAIERDLFKFNKINEGTKKYAAELLKNAKRLRKITASIQFKPEDLANGAASLLEEVLSSKISGEEELFSHYDLVDFAGNLEGARQAFAYLKPGLKKIDAKLTKKVSKRFDAVSKMLDKYRDTDQPGGFMLYNANIKEKDGAKLSRAIQTLQEPLARIAAKVATAGVQ